MRFSLPNNQLIQQNYIVLKIQQLNLLFLNENVSFQIIKVKVKIRATHAVNLCLCQRENYAAF